MKDLFENHDKLNLIIFNLEKCFNEFNYMYVLHFNGNNLEISNVLRDSIIENIKDGDKIVKEQIAYMKDFKSALETDALHIRSTWILKGIYDYSNHHIFKTQIAHFKHLKEVASFIKPYFL